MPEIKIVEEVEGEAAKRLQKCFSPGVIALQRTKSGKKIAIVNDARYDIGCRNVFRYEDLKDTVVMNKVQDHFICKSYALLLHSCLIIRLQLLSNLLVP